MSEIQVDLRRIRAENQAARILHILSDAFPPDRENTYEAAKRLLLSWFYETQAEITAPGYVQIPTEADQAVLMINLASMYLERHAPDRLRPELRQPAGRANAFFV